MSPSLNDIKTSHDIKRYHTPSHNLLERLGIGSSLLTRHETRDIIRFQWVSKWPPACQDLAVVARAEALEILYNHKTPPQPDFTSRKIESLIAETIIRLLEPQMRRLVGGRLRSVELWKPS